MIDQQNRSKLKMMMLTNLDKMFGKHKFTFRYYHFFDYYLLWYTNKHDLFTFFIIEWENEF